MRDGKDGDVAQRDMEEPKVRTLADLGRLAGVSAGTASRALADSPLVKPQTRELIKSLAITHDFRLNLVARRLRTGRSGLIGIVVPLGHERRQHISDPFFMAMLAHLADGLTENGRDILLSRAIPTASDWLDRIVESGMVDGILLIGQSDQEAAISRVAAAYHPLVVWGEVADQQDYCVVGSDNASGGRLAAEHLLSRGCRNLVFMGDIHVPEIAARYDGVAAAFAVAGRRPPPVLPASLAAEAVEAEVAARLDHHHGDVDGIVAASDVIAIAALRVLADRSIAVPDQVKIIGYDDLPLATQAVPRLSSIRQDIACGAATMCELLFRRIAGQVTPSVRLPPTLVIRQSSG